MNFIIKIKNQYLYTYLSCLMFWALKPESLCFRLWTACFNLEKSKTSYTPLNHWGHNINIMLF